MRMSPKIYAILFSTAAVLGLAATIWVSFADPPLCGVKINSRQLPNEAMLLSHEGRFERPWGKGRTASLIYFGYTFCPDICPFDLDRNAAAASMLRDRGIDINAIFITIDPGRDTLQSLRAFQSFYSNNMFSYTGTADQIRVAADVFGVFFRRIGDDENYYLMDHTTLTYLVTSDGKLVEEFKNDLSSSQLADNTECILGVARRAD